MPERTRPLVKLKSLLKPGGDIARRATEIVALAPKLPPEAIDVMDEALPKVEPLVQVAVMDAYFEMTGDDYHEEDLERIADAAVGQGDAAAELYMFARVALGRITGLSTDRLDEWGDGQIEITAAAQRRRRGRRRAVADMPREKITVIIHGTWASDEGWWQPGGDFYDYVLTDLGHTDLYGNTDRFRWSGKNKDRKRRQAAVALNQWLKAHPASVVNVFGHSHGANVAMLATHEGVRMDKLVMLSPPVRSDYFANWGNVGRAFNVQAAFDPVVTIARGGQWFKNGIVKEKKMSVNGHSSSHESAVWKSQSLPTFVEMPWS